MRAQHRRPRLGEHEVAAAAVADRLAVVVDDVGADAGQRRVAEPGFVGVTPGSGLIMIAPVSVCHHVSTIGQRSPPMTSRYHIQASGLIGSPTEPSSRSDDRSCPSGSSSPHFMNVRIAVGAV